MGWKNVKEQFDIKHIVQVTDKGICIGSSYVHDLIVISLEGQIVKMSEIFSNEELKRYREQFKDTAKLKAAISSPDYFERDITVYTYDGGEIIEKKCEELGWPNVTHDGEMMYENQFSTDRAKVVKWAQKNAAAWVKMCEESLEEKKAAVIKRESELAEWKTNAAKLAAL